MTKAKGHLFDEGYTPMEKVAAAKAYVNAIHDPHGDVELDIFLRLFHGDELADLIGQSRRQQRKQGASDDGASLRP